MIAGAMPSLRVVVVFFWTCTFPALTSQHVCCEKRSVNVPPLGTRTKQECSDVSKAINIQERKVYSESKKTSKVQDGQTFDREENKGSSSSKHVKHLGTTAVA